MKQHIKNLDTFRAIAAIIVMIGHIELFRKSHLGISFLKVPSGHTAVMLFFVISGFLITFLLAKEKGNIWNNCVERFLFININNFISKISPIQI